MNELHKLAVRLLGKPEWMATAALDAARLDYRIVKRNYKPCRAVEGANESRLNLEITSGVVRAVSFG